MTMDVVNVTELLFFYRLSQMVDNLESAEQEMRPSTDQGPVTLVTSPKQQLLNGLDLKDLLQRILEQRNSVNRQTQQPSLPPTTR